MTRTQQTTKGETMKTALHIVAGVVLSIMLAVCLVGGSLPGVMLIGTAWAISATS